MREESFRRTLKEQAKRNKQADKSLENTAFQRVNDTNMPWYDDDLSSISATAEKGQTIVEEDIDQNIYFRGLKTNIFPVYLLLDLRVYLTQIMKILV